jgi:hypothetical protein
VHLTKVSHDQAFFVGLLPMISGRRATVVNVELVRKKGGEDVEGVPAGAECL